MQAYSAAVIICPERIFYKLQSLVNNYFSSNRGANVREAILTT